MVWTTILPLPVHVSDFGPLTRSLVGFKIDIESHARETPADVSSELVINAHRREAWVGD